MSPYLFICLLSVIVHDIHEEVGHTIAGNQCFPFCGWELVYANDTMLIGTRARELNILLKEIEHECATYNLKLNYKTCTHIAMNGKTHIHFSDGTKLEEVDSVVYLGGTITKDAGRLEEIQHRCAQALQTCCKLKFFWRKTNCSHKWKLQIYNAIMLRSSRTGSTRYN